jgi:hypothetical protein
MDNTKRNIGIIVGIMSFMLSMALGLLGNMRPAIMLIRSFACFVISIILSLIVMIAIGKCADSDKPLEVHENTKSPKNNDQNKTEPKTT